ncbi:ATP-binding cassette domain-containing protein [Chitinasiproducens palmae]|uniref:Molybdate transport system permease protein n=1 Tax=Chitinasiproducens palmae TaxID=1770053 RepID=A0A1H2PKW5_9BURK|nr:ATP-binding cassette domain-containing protein [Chitinasiproducens palmae]SDV46655.1 molybdate transport system permease protein [Chitinasiproducens palmae]
MPTRPGLPRALRALAVLLAAYLLAPLLAALPALGSADWHVLSDRALWQAALVSFGGATLATVLIALGGVPLGYYLARHTGALARTLAFIVQAPLALPPLVSGVLLLFLIGPYAPLGTLFSDAGLQLTDAFAGVVLAQVFVAAPFAVIAARSAFAALDPGLEEVAATLGLRPAQRFMKVALPLAARGIAAGLLLAWLRAIGEFGATVMVAYHPYSLPVFTFVSFGSQGLDAMLPVLLPTLLATLAVVALAAGVQSANLRRSGRGARLARQRLMDAEIDAEVDAAPLADPPSNKGAATDADAQLTPASPNSDAGAAAPDHRAASLQLRLRHRYPGFALDVSITSNARRLAIVGPSGCGKSLSLKLVAGVAPQRADRRALRRAHRRRRTADVDAANLIRIDGVALEQVNAEARRIAYVPQNYALFPHLSLAEQCLLAPDADAGKVARWAKALGLDTLLERRPAALSLGQQQRAALVRALARPSRLILLDEPCSALDTPLRSQLRRALRELQTRIDATTIVVSHDPQDALELADEIVVMDAGRVLQQGRTADVLRRPATLSVARLLDVRNVLPVRRTADGAIAWGNQSDGHVALRMPTDRMLPGATAPAEQAEQADCLLRIPTDAVHVVAIATPEPRSLRTDTSPAASDGPTEVAPQAHAHLSALVESVYPTADGQWLRCAVGDRTLECAYRGTSTVAAGARLTLAIDVARLDCWPAAHEAATAGATPAQVANPAALATPAAPPARARAPT